MGNPYLLPGMKEMKESNIEQAIKQGVKAVSYHWIMACDEQKRRLPEVEFPPGFDPKRALNISGRRLGITGTFESECLILSFY